MTTSRERTETKRGPGQPRKYPSNAARQAAYDARKRQEQREERVVFILDRLPDFPNEMTYKLVAQCLRNLPLKKLGQLRHGTDEKLEEWYRNIVRR